jgi:tetratricopeptide (TPR) repeat protein
VAFCGGIGLALWLFSGVSAEQRRPEPPLEQVFQQYVEQTEINVQELLAPRLRQGTSVDWIRRDLNALFERWPPQEVAAFAVEVVHALVQAETGGVERTLELATDRLRDHPVSRFDALWHRAVFAVLTGAPSDQPGLRAPFFRWAALAAAHYRDAARRRVPADPQVALAWAINREATFHLWLRSWAAARGIEPDRPVPTNEHSAHEWLQQADEALVQARVDDSLREEAGVRLGLMRMYRGNPAEALELWRAQAAASDPRWRYLALLFQGRQLAASGKTDEAEAAFEAGLDVVPRAPSAAVPLAALRYLTSPPAAAALLDALLQAPPALDPWWSYTSGEPERHLREMRQSLR